MLFNSYEFILLFVPAVVAVYYALGPAHRQAALSWLIVASLFFYAWWRPFNVLLIAPSIGVNYAVVRLLLRVDDRRPKLSAAAFVAGIAFNLAFLGYFKYRNFFLTVSNDVLDTSFALDALILPLGISFITFQKIALLVDVRAGLVTKVRLRDYALFVLFFPPLIAGPIVHYRELMPQFAVLDGRWRSEDFAVGLTLFFTGLFKKVVFADPIAALINPTWAAVAVGGHPALLQAWAAALGYMLQLYFDFSGYSDMAIGAARLFGVKLPFNFNSPLKATNIIDFWSRWHITLTRFLTFYIFSPMTIALTRRRAAQRLPVVAGRTTTLTAFLVLLAWPTMVTMVLAGVWHGAGYQFLVFGALHGVALVVNHAWRLRRPRWWPSVGTSGLIAELGCWALTFLFVVVAEVFFRATSLGAAFALLQGMTGANGVTLPMALIPHAAPLLEWMGLHAPGVWESGSEFVQVWGWIAAGLIVVLGMPNILEILADHDPALGFKVRPAGRTRLLRAVTWSPAPSWAGLSLVTVLGLLSLGRLSDFLYWHF
ncbi:MAG TPA: MBOAT family O-acyltransferase [Acetobacteraceae bacterium]|nr:MBOAT family O-acyltransferase [Acetobacteraceae bacterium]